MKSSSMLMAAEGSKAASPASWPSAATPNEDGFMLAFYVDTLDANPQVTKRLNA